MNVDIRVAHSDDLDGAHEGFIYEDLDGELDQVALIAEVYKDLAVDYVGYSTEILTVLEEGTKVLVRLTRPVVLDPAAGVA